MEKTKPMNNNEEEFAVKFVDPYEIIKNLNIAPGMRVADFGCGAGHFSLALAKMIGESGVVYAFDILPEKVGAVISMAKGRGLSNVIAQRANLEKVNGSKLAAESIDLVVIKDMLFQNKDKKVILAEAERILKKGGTVLIIEWKTSNEAIGPEKKLRLSKDDIVAVAQPVGLSILKEIPAGSFHSSWIFMK